MSKHKSKQRRVISKRDPDYREVPPLITRQHLIERLHQHSKLCTACAAKLADKLIGLAEEHRLDDEHGIIRRTFENEANTLARAFGGFEVRDRLACYGVGLVVMFGKIEGDAYQLTKPLPKHHKYYRALEGCMFVSRAAKQERRHENDEWGRENRKYEARQAAVQARKAAAKVPTRKAA